ncbi:MAG: hypothetical protein IIC46_03770 [Planctomycetes bacterium]|nr:hypothetical protein [Planctomycetota bacterium]
MANIDDNPKDLTLAEAISYLAFDCLLAKEDLAARQESHSDRSEVQSAMVKEMLDTILPGEELPKGLKPEEEKKRREELKQEEARKTRLYGGAKLDWIYSLKGDWRAFTPDDAAKIDDACNRLVRVMIDEKVTGTGRLKKDDELNDERQNIPSGFLRSGVHVEPLSDSIDEDILLPGNFGRPLKGYRYVRINRAELVAAKRAGKQQPDRSSGGFSDDPSQSPEAISDGSAQLPEPPPPKKRGGGLKRGRYYGPLKKHLKWRKDEKDDLDTASLKELREDAWRRLTTDGVTGIPKTRSTFEDAIKAALRDLGVNR